MVYELEWVSEYKEKICSDLQKKISDMYSAPQWIPSFVTKSIQTARKHISKIPIVIEIEKNHLYSNLNKDNLGGVLGVQVGHKIDLINSITTKVNLKTIQLLVKNDAVAKIWLDKEVRALLDIASPVVNASLVWDHKFKGKGVGIAVLDTGIYPHSDLTQPKNRIIRFKDFINYRSQPYDDHGHGTHCAGDAAGNGIKSGGKYRGPAPEANLIGVKVLDRKGSGSVSTILAGIQWCIKNKDKYGIKIISMSLGAPASASYREDPLCRAVKNAWKKGLVVCAAAGNEGPVNKTINSPGLAPDIITVGALDDKNTVPLKDDSIAYFSSRGPTIDGLTKPDLVAPGANIISLRAPGSELDSKKLRVGKWYTTMSGTSMATPVCAGVTALILQSNPGLTPAAVKTILMSTCRTVSLDPNAQGAGLIDAAAGVKLSKEWGQD